MVCVCVRVHAMHAPPFPVFPTVPYPQIFPCFVLVSPKILVLVGVVDIVKFSVCRRVLFFFVSFCKRTYVCVLVRM